MLEYTRQKLNDPTLRAAYNASDSVDSALDIFHLEAEPTRRLMEFCEKYHISNDLPAAHGHPHLFPENERL